VQAPCPRVPRTRTILAVEDNVFTLVLLPLALGCIMVTLGFSLTLADFRRVLTAPRGVLIGLVNLFFVAPLLAFGVAELFGLAPAFAVGLVLLGASPGGTMANLMTHLAKGETALSITMTAISSVAAVITVPIFLTLAINHFGADLDSDVEMVGVALRVLAITIVPLAIGMTVRHRAPGWVRDHEALAKRIALGIYVVIIVAVIATEWRRVTDHLGELAGAALFLNVAAMLLSFWSARAARLGPRTATAISIELGMHNATLAIAVGASIDTVLTVPAAVYSSFMFVTAGAFAWMMHRRNGAELSEDEAAATAAPAIAP